MKICVTSKGAGLDSGFEERFGRTPYFIFHDIDSKATESVENPFAGESGGVGPRAAQLVIDHQADVLITGQMGDNASRAMKSSGKQVFSFKGDSPVSYVLEEYRAGKLKQLQ